MLADNCDRSLVSIYIWKIFLLTNLIVCFHFCFCLQLQSGECKTACSVGYYSDKGICERCYMSCRTCSGPGEDQCVTCPAGWQLLAGECRPYCPEGFYKTMYGCQKCHYSCNNCVGEYSLSCIFSQNIITIEFFPW